MLNSFLLTQGEDMFKVSSFLKICFSLLILFSLNAHASLMADCNASANEVNKISPKKLDSITTLLSAVCTNDGGSVTLVYKNNLSTPVTQSQINSLKPGMLDSWCTDPLLKPLINSLNIRYMYSDTSGRKLGQVDLNKRECR